MFIVPSYPAPGNYQAIQETTTVGCKVGRWCHHAWIVSRHGKINCSVNSDTCQRERAYPCWQANKLPGDFQKNIYKGGMFIRFWVKSNTYPKTRNGVNAWHSPATATFDSSSSGDSVVTLEIDPDGYLNIFHVPYAGMAVRIFQVDSVNDPSGSARFPLNQWNRVDWFLKPDSNGYTKVWLNGKLNSTANLFRRPYISFVHLGLYASPDEGPCPSSGCDGVPGDSVEYWNDGVVFESVANEAEAVANFRPDVAPRGF